MVTKRELVEDVARRRGVSAATAISILDGCIEAIQNVLVADDEVDVYGLGNFARSQAASGEFGVAFEPDARMLAVVNEPID